jgi:hypothetical protein
MPLARRGRFPERLLFISFLLRQSDARRRREDQARGKPKPCRSRQTAASQSDVQPSWFSGQQLGPGSGSGGPSRDMMSVLVAMQRRNPQVVHGVLHRIRASDLQSERRAPGVRLRSVSRCIYLPWVGTPVRGPPPKVAMPLRLTIRELLLPISSAAQNGAIGIPCSADAGLLSRLDARREPRRGPHQRHYRPG